MMGLKDRGRFDLGLQRRNECFVVQKKKRKQDEAEGWPIIYPAGPALPRVGGIFQSTSRGFLGDELDTDAESFENRSAPGGPTK